MIYCLIILATLLAAILFALISQTSSIYELVSWGFRQNFENKPPAESHRLFNRDDFGEKIDKLSRDIHGLEGVLFSIKELLDVSINEGKMKVMEISEALSQSFPNSKIENLGRREERPDNCILIKRSELITTSSRWMADILKFRLKSLESKEVISWCSLNDGKEFCFW